VVLVYGDGLLVMDWNRPTQVQEFKMTVLKNLISDIEATLDNEVYPSEADIEMFIQDVHEVIRKSFIRDPKNGLRFSNIGKPDRMLWYTLNMPEKAEPLHASTRIKFMYGDLLEALLVLLIKTAGYKVTDQQQRIEVDGVVGHTDGRINGRLVDYKSASPHSFEKFRSGKVFNEDPFGYVAQISGYAHDRDEDASWVVINKVDGKITVCDIDSLEMINFEDRIKHVRKVLANDKPPGRCYEDKPDGQQGNRVLAIGCAYCDFKAECWKDANNGKGLRKFKYAHGPKFFTHVEKRPQQQIEEVTMT
jgi:hypothetical protein